MIEEHLDPILLFRVRISDDFCGVYYVPQQGVGIEGTPTDGSLRTVAHHIATSQCVEYEPEEINPGELTEDSIIRAVSAWITKEN